jgi:multiple sugar transport system substrate-binding protein
MAEAGRTHLNLVGRDLTASSRRWRRRSRASSASIPTSRWRRASSEPQVLDESTIAREGLAEGDVDVTLTLTDCLPEAMQRGLLAPLDEYLAADPPEGRPDDWSASLRGLQRDPAGRTCALPYHDGPMM